MKLRHYALAAILVLTFFTLSCKRDDYKAPDLTGPAVNDLYLLINVNPTVVPAGGIASVRVRLMGAEGPVANAPVTFMVENAAGTALYPWATLTPTTTVTDASGYAYTRLDAPASLWNPVQILIVADAGKDIYTDNNRQCRASALVLLTTP